MDKNHFVVVSVVENGSMTKLVNVVILASKRRYVFKFYKSIALGWKTLQMAEISKNRSKLTEPWSTCYFLMVPHLCPLWTSFISLTIFDIPLFDNAQTILYIGYSNKSLNTIFLSFKQPGEGLVFRKKLKQLEGLYYKIQIFLQKLQ